MHAGTWKADFVGDASQPHAARPMLAQYAQEAYRTMQDAIGFRVSRFSIAHAFTLLGSAKLPLSGNSQ